MQGSAELVELAELVEIFFFVFFLFSFLFFSFLNLLLFSAVESESVKNNGVSDEVLRVQ